MGSLKYIDEFSLCEAVESVLIACRHLKDHEGKIVYTRVKPHTAYELVVQLIGTLTGEVVSCPSARELVMPSDMSDDVKAILGSM